MTRGTASHLFCSFLFFVASFWLQKKLFGKTFWNKVVKKKRCGRSYWRCQDVILWKIKILSRIALVVRRVGGLEVLVVWRLQDRSVVRRVGGLEVLSARLRRLPEVVRRVGGLEVYGLPGVDDGLVVRRVGGLEGGHERRQSVRCPPCRRFRSMASLRRVGTSCCPPCRRFRSLWLHRQKWRRGCPPCRRFRSSRNPTVRDRRGCPPCRRFRSVGVANLVVSARCPPCRRFRRCRWYYMWIVCYWRRNWS